MIKLNYKDVAFKQAANGLWTAKIVDICKAKSNLSDKLSRLTLKNLNQSGTHYLV